MNGYKFCFIICANDESYLNECLWYIDQIVVPDGYEKECVVIRDADSMTSGYNRAMVQSDAKYKIYLHQDVFIMNKNILEDLLDFFRDESIGMVGVVGRKEFLNTASYSLDWDAGVVEVCTESHAVYGCFPSAGNKGVIHVTAIDGMFMATQYDLTWDEKFDGWDFYDISHSLAFQKAGYQIIVPYINQIENRWIFHDAGYCEYKDWEKWRKIFCERYASEGYEYVEPEWADPGIEKEEKQLQVEGAFERGNFEEVDQLLFRLKGCEMNSTLAYIGTYVSIWKGEMGAYGKSRFSELTDLKAFIDEYNEIKFLIRRFHFEPSDINWERIRCKLHKGILQGCITMKMLWVIVRVCVADSNHCWRTLLEKYQKEIHSLLVRGEILEAEQFLLSLDEKWRGREGKIFLDLIQIFRYEVKNNVSTTVFDVFQDPEQWVAHYMRAKCYLRRMEFELPESYQKEGYDYCVQTGVSDYFIFYILQHNVFFRERFCSNMSLLFAREEGEGSIRANLYAQLAEDENRMEGSDE